MTTTDAPLSLPLGPSGGSDGPLAAARVVGDGDLAHVIAGEIGPGDALPRRSLESPTAVLTTVDPAAVIVAVADDGDEAWLAAATRWAYRHGQPILTVLIEQSHAVVGPFAVPPGEGCFDCWTQRRWAASTHRAAERTYLATRRHRVTPLATPPALRVVAVLAARMLLTAGDQAQWPMAYHVALRPLTVRRRQFMPAPECPTCGSQQPDNRSRASITLASRSTPTPASTRLRSYDELAQIVDPVVDPIVGLVQDVGVVLDHDRTALAQAVTRMPGEDRTEYTFGRGTRYSASRTAAILEALERYAGHRPRAITPAVRASYIDVASDAIDPAVYGGHHPAGVAKLDGQLVPYSPTRAISWVWGYSFRRAAPVLVPEQLAYYRSTPPDERFVYEVSNGCALGSCLEEAILHGLLEVIERDSFLLTWYTRRPATPIDLAGADDPEVGGTADRLMQAGYSLHVYDTTTDIRVPSVWAMLVNSRRRAPYAMCASGAHLDFTRAVAAALGELAVSVTIRERQSPQELRRGAAMLAGSEPVRAMEDHALLYTLPDAFSRLEHLPLDAAATPIADRQRRLPSWYDTDLSRMLTRLIAEVLTCTVDVVVVDQTTPEQHRLDLRTVKVLVPGTLPMTFGEHRRRVEGLPRVLEAPQRLGYANRPLRLDELNPYPHPFP